MKSNDKSLLAWLGDSKVRKVLFHATDKDFDSFDCTKGDLGSHFGNYEQANYVADKRKGYESGVRIIPVLLKMKNPLRLKDVGSFHADGVAFQLEKLGLLRKGYGKKIESECDSDWKLRRKYNPIILDAIINEGYDGVVYANKHEGFGDSYIAINSAQIAYLLSKEHYPIEEENKYEKVRQRI